jgi:hypothetical protein
MAVGDESVRRMRQSGASLEHEESYRAKRFDNNNNNNTNTSSKAKVTSTANKASTNTSTSTSTPATITSRVAAKTDDIVTSGAQRIGVKPDTAARLGDKAAAGIDDAAKKLSSVSIKGTKAAVGEALHSETAETVKGAAAEAMALMNGSASGSVMDFVQNIVANRELGKQHEQLLSQASQTFSALNELAKAAASRVGTSEGRAAVEKALLSRVDPDVAAAVMQAASALRESAGDNVSKLVDVASKAVTGSSETAGLVKAAASAATNALPDMADIDAATMVKLAPLLTPVLAKWLKANGHEDLASAVGPAGPALVGAVAAMGGPDAAMHKAGQLKAQVSSVLSAPSTKAKMSMAEEYVCGGYEDECYRGGSDTDWSDGESEGGWTDCDSDVEELMEVTDDEE